MGYELDRSQTVGENVGRLVSELVTASVAAIRDPEDADEAVHFVRKQLKKVRAVLRLVRPALPAYESENVRYRDIARRLSELRDAKVRLETLELLEGALSASLEPADRERLSLTMKGVYHRCVENASLPDLLDTVAEELEDGLSDLADLEVTAEGFDAVGGGLAKTYRRARARLDEARDEPTVEVMHTLRKRTKYHRHHIDLLSPLWADVLEPWEDVLHDMTDALGDEHDIAVLRAAIFDHDWPDDVALDRLDEVLEREAVRRRRASLAIGARVFAERPEAFIERVGSYWAAWSA